MKIIYKSLLWPGQNILQIPVGSEILSVKNQNDNLTIWYLCDPEVVDGSREIYVAPTGFILPDAGTHTKFEFIESVALHSEDLVFHVFEIKKIN